MKIFWIGIQRFLVIRVADPEKYIARGNPFKRALDRVNTGMVGSPIAISSNALRIPFHELRHEVASRFARHAAHTPLAAERGCGS